MIDLKNTLSEQTLECVLPPCGIIRSTPDGNIFRQWLSPALTSVKILHDGSLLWATSNGRKWQIVGQKEEAKSPNQVIRLASDVVDPTQLSLTGATWSGLIEPTAPEVVTGSLDGAFRFQSENKESGRKGLRSPQIGAVHAVMAYWTLRQSAPSTVVMPTGTGKTETMVSLFAAGQVKRLLVLVPSDALREQLAAKFETYGVLPDFGVIDKTALFPVVGRISHGFQDVELALEYARQCNVIIATPQALSHCEPQAKAALLGECSHLFIDEAHHIAAPTWREVRNAFVGKPVVQFTATPFREDGADLGGKIVYVFPLQSAQEQGYFSKINYSAVIDFDDLDRAIAQKAVETLRHDLAQGLNHILMARVNRIGRAKNLLPVYQELAPDLNPVILHSGTGKRERAAALSAVRQSKSRVIICVDMLGEGFDLPTLKIAAMHDPHKSLGITLQFIGRFARAGTGIGNASVVVGRTQADYDENLKRLYAEDADWNHIINDLSRAAIDEQQDMAEFEGGFNSLPEELSLKNLSPRMSTVVYKTFCQDWRVEDLTKHFESKLYTNPIAVNEAEGVIWLVTKETMPVRWGDTRVVEETIYHLYVFYWDRDMSLLFVNSSDTDSLHEDAAKSLCGETLERIKGKNVYRAVAKINRRVPTNIGLLDARDSKRSFAMYSGSNVTEGFPEAQAQTKTQTNIFAYGFEDGQRVSVGISLKGRIWSYLAAPTIKHWVEWCKRLGARLTDESINLDEVIAGFIRPEIIEKRPDLVPLSLEWPWEVVTRVSEEIRVEFKGESHALIDADFRISSFSNSGPIPFTLITPSWSIEYTLTITARQLTFTPVKEDAVVTTGRSNYPLSSYLNGHGLRVIFEEEAVLFSDGLFVKPNRKLPPFASSKLTELDWTGIDIHKESQGPSRNPATVQAHVIKQIQAIESWDFIIDDDSSGEIADIVAIRVDKNRLKIMLVHCKFAYDVPGARVIDLYEVCGQAQKSCEWRKKPGAMLKNLLRRAVNRRKSSIDSFIVGSPEKLLELISRSSFLLPEYHIAIAQPGVSKKAVSISQLSLLASTEMYVRDVADSGLTVFTSS